jgi:hypothetical protein
MSSPVLVIVRPRNSSSGGMTLTFIIRLLQRCEPNFNSHGCQRVPIVERNKERRWTALTPLKLRARIGLPEVTDSPASLLINVDVDNICKPCYDPM